MNTAEFDYDLPPEFIAQTPVEPRDAARLMVLDRESDRIEHSTFRDLGNYLRAGDLLVINETRVIPARLYGRKVPTNGRVEILLLHRLETHTWEALVGGKGVREGTLIQVEGGSEAVIERVMEGGRRLVRFMDPVEEFLDRAGHTPLPPYIHSPLSDPERYQTVYAQHLGSAAAPTAGLHFTPELLAHLGNQGIEVARVSLHVGLDTFAPVTEDDPREHGIHSEWCQVSSQVVDAVRQARRAGRRVIAVGTTTVRTLESAASSALEREVIRPYEGPTSLFILPGYSFRVVDGMITNFHLPRSTLIMLVSAFVGREKILAAYEVAKKEKYRFYSFGDAILILPH
jgi:S-adenosylmethionine:tRNA ribosyltransferase-isomerase